MAREIDPYTHTNFIIHRSMRHLRDTLPERLIEILPYLAPHLVVDTVTGGLICHALNIPFQKGYRAMVAW